MGNGKFQWLINQTDSVQSQPLHDILLFETENFAALPSLGNFLRNWILLVPKRPVPCLAGLYGKEVLELLDAARHVTESFKLDPKNVFLFEHGGAYGSPINCGVDQAHLHVVECNFNLIEAAINASDEMQWVGVPSGFGGLKKIVADREYLAVGNDKKLFVSFPKQPESQWFRKLIAKENNTPDLWDYKANPFYAAIETSAQNFWYLNDIGN